MLRFQMRIVKNGNASAVTIPRAVLATLGWIPGRSVILELTEDCDAVLIRLPRAEDFGPVGPSRMLPSAPGAKA